MTPSLASLELPSRYRPERHVANGGMAAVWLAHDEVLGRAVAIKLLAAHLAEDPTAVRRFMREARAAATVSHHPHVVTIYDVVEHAGRPFIVMEYLPGGTLATVLRGGRPPRADVLGWLGEAASALDAAHERGIVHRDVKPANLLLDERRRLAVADFGIARLAFETAVTETGQVLGTAAYLSPEQARGESATPASDRYALAVVAYELLAGRKPFVADNFAAQARMQIEKAPPPASAHVAGLAPAADRVLARGLAKDPAERWPSAERFVAELRAALGETAAAPAPAPAEDETEATRPLPRGNPPRRTAPLAVAGRPDRRRRVAMLAGLAAVLVALAVAIAALGGGDSAPRDSGDRVAAERERTAERDRTGEDGGGRGGESGAGEGVAALNDRGFRLMNQERYGEAIPVLRSAVERCGSSRELVCAYALYNLGRSLRLAGRPAEAIPVLERRMQYPNQQDVVAAELEAARRAAGQTGGDDVAEGGEDSGGKGRGRGKGKKGED